MVPGGLGQPHDVAEQRAGHVHLPGHHDHLRDALGVGDGVDVLERGRHAVRGQDGRFRIGPRVTDGEPHHEPVELRLGQRVGPLVLDRVLRCDHHERDPQVIRHAVHRDLVLLHALQEGRLGLWAGPVDLVSEHDVGEDGPGLELEVTPFLVVDVDAGDVGGQEVRGELDPPERAVDGAGDRLGQHGLADPRHVLDQQMAFRDEADQG